jgi:hypothetical protein
MKLSCIQNTIISKSVSDYRVTNDSCLVYELDWVDIIVVHLV